MKDTKQLLNQLEREIGQSPKTSTTAAGRPEPSQDNPSKRVFSNQHIDAINQVFALFRINYHNQYHAAFGDSQTLTQAKKLWAEMLADLSPEHILRGAKKAIERSDYLPTIHRLLTYCQADPEELGLPDAHSAYLEACRAPNPKANHNWSHPAVYHAGRQSDWYFLANNPERDTFPEFKQHYLQLCQQVLSGDSLSSPDPVALDAPKQQPLSSQENADRLKLLREQFDL